MKISDNQRYLIHEDGTPFFFLADTAWSLFYEIGREDARWYLEERARQGFTVIMATAVREGGIDQAINCQEDAPFLDKDPKRINEAFFRHVDGVLEDAARVGLRVAFLPTWGEFVTPLWGKGPKIFDAESASSYGEFLGRRYADSEVIWVVGGDRDPVNEEDEEIWRALAAGLQLGDGGRNRMTYHPKGGSHSSSFFHQEPWLDFNMMQSGKRWDMPNYEFIRQDYDRVPVKPTVEGEAQYENSHEQFFLRPPQGARIDAHQVRKAAYFAVLSGAMGHTYGCRDVFFFHKSSGASAERDMDTHWRDAVRFPGAQQMGIMRRLMEEHSWHRLVPDRDMKFVTDGVGEGGTCTIAAFSPEAGKGLVYFPERKASTVQVGCIGNRARATWFDPATGEYGAPWEVAGDSITFEPPPESCGADRVLVLQRI